MLVSPERAQLYMLPLGQGRLICAAAVVALPETQKLCWKWQNLQEAAAQVYSYICRLAVDKIYEMRLAY